MAPGPGSRTGESGPDVESRADAILAALDAAFDSPDKVGAERALGGA